MWGTLVSVAFGAVLGTALAWWRERSHRRHERRADAYAQAVGVLGAYVDHYRRVANDEPTDPDPVPNMELHRVHLLVQVDGTTDAEAAYQAALLASMAFHDAVAKRLQVRSNRTEPLVFEAFDRYEQAAMEFKKVVLDELA